MMKTTRKILRGALMGAAVVGVLAAAPARAEDDRCMYKGTSFSEGGQSCQSGTLFRCEDGEWKSSGIACQGNAAPVAGEPVPANPNSPRTCAYQGATVASTSTICKSGTTFRCDDGAWVSLGTPCS